MALTKALGSGGGGGSGTVTTVKDEGSTLSSAVTSIDFVGAGVTATGTTAVTATIPGLPSGHPDIPPTSPTLFSGVAYDLEFATLGAHGGTVLGSPATAPSIVDGALRIVGGTSGTFDIKGVEWACPGSAFTMTAKFRRRALNTNYHIAPLFIRAGASGAGNMAGLVWFQNPGGWSVPFVGYHRYSALTTRTANLSEVGAWPLPAQYLQIVYDGTNVTPRLSASGHADSFGALRAAETATTAIGAAPGRFLVGMDSLNTTDPGVLYVEWIRFT